MLAPLLVEAHVHISRIGWIAIGLAVLAAVVQAVIARIIVSRRLKANFPLFLSYSCFGVVMVGVGLAGYLVSSCAQYFYLYWVLSFLYMVLEFGIMYEIFVNALKPYSALIDLGKMLFRWAAVFLLFAGVLTALATAGSQANRLVAAVALVERSMRLMQCGLLLLFFFFERRLGLSWRNHNMAIALGLGAGAAMDLTVSYLKAHYSVFGNTFGIANSIFYLGVLCFWASNLSQTEPARSNVLDSPRRLIFQRWNEALLTHSVRGEMAFAAGGMESFLPGVEQTVDRVLARKIVQ
jgi:hypothetical protein